MSEKPDKKYRCPTCKINDMSKEDANFWGECKSCRKVFWLKFAYSNKARRR